MGKLATAIVAAILAMSVPAAAFTVPKEHMAKLCFGGGAPGEVLVLAGHVVFVGLRTIIVDADVTAAGSRPNRHEHLVEVATIDAKRFKIGRYAVLRVEYFGEGIVGDRFMVRTALDKVLAVK